MYLNTGIDLSIAISDLGTIGTRSILQKALQCDDLINPKIYTGL